MFKNKRSVIIFPSNQLQKCNWCDGGVGLVYSMILEDGQISLCNSHKADFLTKFNLEKQDFSS